MRLIAILRIALNALKRNKLRTMLTTLVIVIGVAAVIAIVGIRNGARNLKPNRGNGAEHHHGVS